MFELISAYVDDADMDARSRAGMLSHLADCPGCAQLLAALKGMQDDLAGLPKLADTAAPPELLSSIMTAVINERSSSLGKPEKNGGKGKPHLMSLRPWALAAACVALALTGYIFITHPASSPNMANNTSGLLAGDMMAPEAAPKYAEANDAPPSMAGDNGAANEAPGADRDSGAYGSQEAEEALNAFINNSAPGTAASGAASGGAEGGNARNMEGYAYIMIADNVAPELLERLIDDCGLAETEEGYAVTLSLERLYQAFLLLNGYDGGQNLRVETGDGGDMDVNMMIVYK